MDLSKISDKLDALLTSVDMSNTTEEGVNASLPDGYYLCEVSKASLGESKNGNPMVKIELEITEDGKKIVVDKDTGYSQLEEAKGTKGQKIFTNYVLTNEMNVNFFVSDMLKFQDSETDEPFFTKDDFLSTEGICNVCEILETGATIYMMLQTVEKDGNKDQKKKPISWKRARKLELI